jgi:ABC-type phosphate transport system permease subunit
MSNRYWFRPKSFGYGWTPISWKGWAVTLGSMGVTMAAILTAAFAEAHRWPDRRPFQATCLIVFVATLIVTIVVSRNKTEGDG